MLSKVLANIWAVWYFTCVLSIGFYIKLRKLRGCSLHWSQDFHWLQWEELAKNVGSIEWSLRVYLKLRLHQLDLCFLAKLFVIAEPVFYTDNMRSRVICMWLWGICTMACLKGVCLLRSAPWRSEVQTSPLFLCSLFLCNHITMAECWERERATHSLGAERRVCKVFLPEKNLNLVFHWCGNCYYR